MNLAVYNTKGQETGQKVALPKEIFGVEPNDHAIWLDVKNYLAHQRQGTSKSKERGEIAGSTRKLRKQKGAGAARVGSIKSPLFTGGGRIFGPKPRDYGFKLNKKVSRAARVSALTYKAKENNIVVLEDFVMDKPRTKDFQAILQALKVEGQKTLVLTPKAEKNTVLSSRNITGTRVMCATDINTYEILHAGKLIVTQSSLPLLESILK